MKTELIQYKAEHGFALLARQVQEMGFCLSAVGDWEAMVKYWAEAGPSFTLLIDGTVEACGGIAPIDRGFGECWALIPQAKHGIIIYKNILVKFRELMNTYEFRRLQAHVMKDFVNGIKLAEHLGMKREGWLEKFGHGGETYGIYARVF